MVSDASRTAFKTGHREPDIGKVLLVEHITILLRVKLIRYPLHIRSVNNTFSVSEFKWTTVTRCYWCQ